MSDDNIATSERVGDAPRALVDAANRGDVEDVRKVLADSKTYVDGKIDGRTALSYVAEAGNAEVVQLLLDRGADINEKDKYGRSPLSHAAQAGKAEIVQLLLDRGADITEKDNYGRSPLRIAAQAGKAEVGHINIVTTLIDAGADVDPMAKHRWYRYRDGITHLVFNCSSRNVASENIHLLPDQLQQLHCFLEL
uniref:Uncharacterized protein n=1 Tax=Globisporangium ultimum (strain ATCC 200006 / CBS 805.95 / DAOM BR144) TaxID=431595 RepID=K3XBW9_GLOUD